MPRLSLTIVLPVALVLVVLALFGQKAGFWGRPDPAEPKSTATAGATPQAAPERGGNAGAGSGDRAANAIPPPGEMNPVPAGRADVQDRRTPSSATQTAPSGEPATRPGGG